MVSLSRNGVNYCKTAKTVGHFEWYRSIVEKEIRIINSPHDEQFSLIRNVNLTPSLYDWIERFGFYILGNIRYVF